MDRIYTSASTVGNPAFFEPEVFPWVGVLEANWRVIREELDEVLRYRDELPNFQDISPEQASLSADNKWKTYFFYAYGVKAGNIERCPRTAELLWEIPGMKTAFFSILGPRKHLPPHRGPYKGVIRYHLGLKIPEPSTACGIRVGQRRRKKNIFAHPKEKKTPSARGPPPPPTFSPNPTHLATPLSVFIHRGTSWTFVLRAVTYIILKFRSHCGNVVSTQ